MAMFTLTDDTVINTDYVTVVWPIFKDRVNGNDIWCYYITLHGSEDKRLYQRFDMEETTKAHRSSLISMIANK